MESPLVSHGDSEEATEKAEHTVMFKTEDQMPFEIDLNALDLKLDVSGGEGQYVSLDDEVLKDKKYLHIGIFSGDHKIGTIGVSLGLNGRAVIIDSQLVWAHENAGKGIGKAAYINLANYLKEKHGLKLNSNKFMKPSAEHMWKSLENAGKAKLVREWNSDKGQYDQYYEFI